MAKIYLLEIFYQLLIIMVLHVKVLLPHKLNCLVEGCMLINEYTTDQQRKQDRLKYISITRC